MIVFTNFRKKLRTVFSSESSMESKPDKQFHTLNSTLLNVTCTGLIHLYYLQQNKLTMHHSTPIHFHKINCAHQQRSHTNSRKQVRLCDVSRELYTTIDLKPLPNFCCPGTVRIKPWNLYWFWWEDNFGRSLFDMCSLILFFVTWPPFWN